MNLSKNTFLYAYALFLFICLFLVILDGNNSYINDLISAISIASTSISFAELFYTKTSIDKKEREQLIYLYNYCNKKSNQINNEMSEKYKKELDKIDEIDIDSDIEALMDDKIDIDKIQEINKGIEKAEKKEKNSILIANIIIIIGFTFLLIVLTIDNMFGEYTSVINNFLTVFAFLSVILNVLIKDNFKAKSLEELDKARKDLLSIK